MILNSNRKMKKVLLGGFFLAPIFIFYGLFYLLPLIRGIIMSFTNWHGSSVNYTFIGFKNYYDAIFADPFFKTSIATTFKFAALNIILTNSIAMCFALGLTIKFKLNHLIRTAIFLPNMISMVVVGFLWRFVFNGISPELEKLTNIDFFGTLWLSAYPIVIYSIVIVSIWHGVGYIMTIYIAGLEGVDDNIVEASVIDGANAWTQFWKIKLPMMKRIFAMGFFINVVGSLKIFDLIISLTAGGPGRSSEVAMINIYREAFVNNQLGYGAAKSILLTLLIVLFALIQVSFSRRKNDAAN